METEQKYQGLTVVCGPMFAGKTTELIKLAKHFSGAGERIQIFKHSLDNRFDNDCVVSHDSVFLPAIPVSSAMDATEKIDTEATVFFFDEIQFFDFSIFRLFGLLLSKGRRIICCGLDMDFKGTPFPVMERLLAMADLVVKKKGKCAVCGKPSGFSYLNETRPEKGNILIGGADKYSPLCRFCFLSKIKQQET